MTVPALFQIITDYTISTGKLACTQVLKNDVILYSFINREVREGIIPPERTRIVDAKGKFVMPGQLQHS